MLPKVRKDYIKLAKKYGINYDSSFTIQKIVKKLNKRGITDFDDGEPLVKNIVKYDTNTQISISPIEIYTPFR